MLIATAILVSIMDDPNLCFILDLMREQLLSPWQGENRLDRDILDKNYWIQSKEWLYN